MDIIYKNPMFCYNTNRIFRLLHEETNVNEGADIEPNMVA